MTYRDWSVERSNSKTGSDGVRKGRGWEAEERIQAVRPRCRGGRDEATKTARSQDTILTWVTRRMEVKCKIIRETCTCGYMLFDRELSRRKNSFSCIKFTAWGRLFYEKQSALDLLRYILVEIIEYIVYNLIEIWEMNLVCRYFKLKFSNVNSSNNKILFYNLSISVLKLRTT